MSFARNVGIGLLIIGLGACATARPACVQIRLSAYPFCQMTQTGLVLASSDEDAHWGVAAATQAGREFGRYFGAVPRHALLIRDGETRVPRELELTGYGRVFHSNTLTGRSAALRTAMRDAWEEKLRLDGVPEPERGRRIEQVLNSLSRDEVSGQVSLVAHEMGHMLLQSFWDGKTPPGYRPRYGTDAPDWFDEIGAMLMESGESRENRRKLLTEVFRGGRMIPLHVFLSMHHPNSPVPNLPGEAGETEPATNEEHEPLAARYYSQGLGFAEFLIERGGQPLIFKAIAEKLAAGWSFERWLMAEGPRYHLPPEVTGLTRAWEEWLVNKHGSSR